MWQRTILSLIFGLSFLVLGWLQPSAVLLDASFGLAYFLAEVSGLWRPGPIWVSEYPSLETFCFLVWPLIASTLLGYGVTFVATKLWIEGAKHSRLYAVIFIIAVFALTFAFRVEPGTFRCSYFGHWAENY